MAQINVQGKVTFRQVRAGRDGRGDQMQLMLSDGQSFGCFVDLDHPLADVKIGDMVDVTGLFAPSGKYFNIARPRLNAVAAVQWTMAGESDE
jgi:hypothetical protein